MCPSCRTAGWPQFGPCTWACSSRFMQAALMVYSFRDVAFQDCQSRWDREVDQVKNLGSRLVAIMEPPAPVVKSTWSSRIQVAAGGQESSKYGIDQCVSGLAVLLGKSEAGHPRDQPIQPGSSPERPPRWTPSYSAPAPSHSRAQPRVHQLFCGGDWQVNAAFNVNLDVGFDLVGRGPGVVLKSRLEWDWGTRHNR